MKKLFTLISIICVACVASAQTVNMEFQGMDLHHPDKVSININGNDMEVYAGALDFTGHHGFTLTSYCADLGSTLDGDHHTYNVSATDPTNNTGINLAGSIVSQNFSVATSADQEAGLQLAVWAAIYNGGATFNDNSGAFQLQSVDRGDQSAIESYATQYYAAGVNGPLAANYFEISAGCGGQSQLGPMPQAVPAPSSFIFIGLGLAGLVIKRNRS